MAVLPHAARAVALGLLVFASGAAAAELPREYTAALRAHVGVVGLQEELIVAASADGTQSIRIGFKVGKSGRIEDVRILNAQASINLQRIATRLFRRLPPFRPTPDGKTHRFAIPLTIR